MDPQALARFAASCGAFAPLELAIEYHDGTVAAAGSLPQPFALIGRDPNCDVALSSDDLEPQTAFLQVIGGQVFVADLGTKAGLRWPHGRHPFGWLPAGERIFVGPFALRLTAAVSPHPAPFGPAFHPLVPGPDVPPGLPPVELEFKTGQAERSRWPVNRVLTLIGSAADCKIFLTGPGVAPRHCYLLHTPDGLWAVALTGGPGIRVNGHPTRFARLGEADELSVGEFVMSVTYPRPDADDGLISFDDFPLRNRHPAQDSFALSGGLTTDSGPRPQQVPTDFDLQLPPPAPDEPTPPNWLAQEDTDPNYQPPAANPLPDVWPAVRRLGDLHGRMLSDFPQLLAALVAGDGRPEVHDAIARLTVVTAELVKQLAEALRNPQELDHLSALADERQAVWRRVAELIDPPTTIPSR